MHKRPQRHYNVAKLHKEGCAIERKPKRQLRDAKAINEINKERYDRLAIVVPRGKKAVIEDFARQANESINQYTNKAILDRIGISDWTELDIVSTFSAETSKTPE